MSTASISARSGEPRFCRACSRVLVGRVAVPTTLNVGSMDLIHPELFRGGRPAVASDGTRSLMQLHEEIGCLFDLHLRALPDALRPVPCFTISDRWARSIEPHRCFCVPLVIVGLTVSLRRLHRPLCRAHRPRALRRSACAGEPARRDRSSTLPPSRSRGEAGAMRSRSLSGALVGARTGSAIPVIVGLPPVAHAGRL